MERCEGHKKGTGKQQVACSALGAMATMLTPRRAIHNHGEQIFNSEDRLRRFDLSPIKAGM
jgi:hypothetical protein